MMRKVSFVILHYKDVSVTDDCIKSILRMKYQDRIAIVVVDNDIHLPHSKRQILREHFRDIHQIHILTNMGKGGFSEANNLGYKYARDKLKSDCIIVINNDIVFLQRDFISRLCRIEKKYKCHVLGPDVIRKGIREHQNPMDSRIRTKEEAVFTIKANTFALKYYDFLFPIIYLHTRFQEYGRILKKRKNNKYYTMIHENIVPFGACLIFMPEYVLKERKAFEPETQFYYEEYILAARCGRSNYKIMYHPGLKVFHESGKSTRESYKGIKNRMKFIIKNTLTSCSLYLQYISENSN